jgi:hypothetical protein
MTSGRLPTLVHDSNTLPAAFGLGNFAHMLGPPDGDRLDRGLVADDPLHLGHGGLGPPYKFLVYVD